MTFKNSSDNAKIYAMRGLLIAFIVASTATIACGSVFDDGGECPEYDASDAIALESGLFEHVPSLEDIYDSQEPTGEDNTGGADRLMADFPQAGVDQSELEFDRPNERVIVRYERNGQQIVETWRVTGYGTTQRY